MKFIITILFGAIFLTSCITQKKCNDRYPPQVRDSSYTTETLTNCIDTVYKPGETISIPGDSIPCPDLIYHKEIKKGHLTGSVNIKNGILKFDCKSDSLEVIINTLRKEVITNRSKTEVHTGPKEYITRWYDMFCRYATGIYTLLLLGLIAGRILSMKKIK